MKKNKSCLPMQKTSKSSSKLLPKIYKLGGGTHNTYSGKSNKRK